MTSQEKALREFAEFAAKLNRDDKGEARAFPLRLVAAFGHGKS